MLEQTPAFGRIPLTIVLQRVRRVSNRVLRAATVSSGPPSPFKRARLNRIYQFVSSSMSSKSLGMTVYSLYAIAEISWVKRQYAIYLPVISSRTSLISDWHLASTQRSIIFEEMAAWSLYRNFMPVSRSKSATWPRKKRKELTQGKSTRAITSFTPSSRNLRFSARTIGELTKNILRTILSLDSGIP